MDWRKLPLNYIGIVDALFLGTWRVGHVTANFTYPAAPDGKFDAFCHLPGIQTSLGPFDDAEQAKKALENVTRNWVTQAGLKS